MPHPQNDEVILFCTNGDGTVNCAWCDEIFNADDAVPDAHDQPICPECYADAKEHPEDYADDEEAS